ILESRSINPSGSGLSAIYNDATGVLSITGSAAASVYETVLRTLRYNNVSQNPATANRIIEVSVTSAAGVSTVQTSIVTVEAVNDEPGALAQNTSLSTPQDTPLTLSTGNTSALSVADIDAGNNPVRVTLNAGNGTISLSGISGLSFTTGDGTGDTVMTFTGTI